MAIETSAPVGIRDWGVDLSPKSRPGVPKELPPRPLAHAHWTHPARQIPTVAVFKRIGLVELTPVFGTSAPPHGLSGTVRRFAYTIPEHYARHWALLLFADRIDVLQARIARIPRWTIAAGALLAAGALVLRGRRSRWL